MARTTPRQGNKETEKYTRPGTNYVIERFTERRDPETGKLCEAGTGYEFTFQKYTERWAVSSPESATVGPDLAVGVRTFDYFRVSRRSSKGTEILGQITAHTTESRLESMIYRYYHPDHAKISTFDGPVVESRSRSTAKDGKSRESVFVHVSIPSGTVRDCDYRVDDEAEIHIHNRDGEHYSYKYHLSFRSRTDGDPEDTGSLIVPLSPIRRLVYFKIGERTVFQHVTEAVYREHSERLAQGQPITIKYTYQPRATKAEKEAHGKGWKPEKVTIYPKVQRFICSGDSVTVTIDPVEHTENAYYVGNKKTPIPGRPGRFDFAKESLHVIRLAQKRAQEGRGSEDE